jgi:hypothetical protein
MVSPEQSLAYQIYNLKIWLPEMTFLTNYKKLVVIGDTTLFKAIPVKDKLFLFLYLLLLVSKTPLLVILRIQEKGDYTELSDEAESYFHNLGKLLGI